jgi:hypothetical protein
MPALSLSIQERPFSFPSEIQQDPLLERWDDQCGKEYGFGIRKNSEYWMTFYRAGTFVVQDGDPEVSGFPEPGADLQRFRELFFYVVVPWMIQRQEWECLHASAVLAGSGVVMFTGPSGRGKSTMARAFCDHGAVPYADDAAPFLVRGDSVLCARIPQPLKLREPAASHFTAPKLPVHQDDSEIRWDLKPTLRPLSVIYWLDRMTEGGAQGGAVIEALSQMSAFRLLLEEAHCISMSDSSCNRKMVRNYLSLARLSPVFRLSVPARLDAIPKVVKRIQEHQQSLPRF